MTHIALKALALALKEYKIFNGRKVRLPILGVEGYYPNVSVDVSTAAGIVANGSSNIVKVESADSMSVKEISDFINTNNKKVGSSSGDTTGAGALLPQFLKKPLEILSEQVSLSNTVCPTPHRHSLLTLRCSLTLKFLALASLEGVSEQLLSSPVPTTMEARSASAPISSPLTTASPAVRTSYSLWEV